MVDFDIVKYERSSKMAVADAEEREKWKMLGVREGMSKSGLSQKPVYAILTGKPVRQQTLAIFKRAADNLTA